jgi:hypothetical protein
LEFGQIFIDPGVLGQLLQFAFPQPVVGFVYRIEPLRHQGGSKNKNRDCYNESYYEYDYHGRQVFSSFETPLQADLQGIENGGQHNRQDECIYEWKEN